MSTSSLPAHGQRVNERDAAAFIDLSTHFLRKRRRLGLDPEYIKLGRAIRYDLAELTKFLQRNTVRRLAAK